MVSGKHYLVIPKTEQMGYLLSEFRLVVCNVFKCAQLLVKETKLKKVIFLVDRKKDVIMRACNNKQMYTIKKMAHQIDPKAFTIIMESNEVVGEGFKEGVKEL